MQQQVQNRVRLFARIKFLRATLGQAASALILLLVMLTPCLAGDSITNHAQGANFYPTYPLPQLTPNSNTDLINKGQYLVKIGDCISCHTNSPGGGQPFAGGLAIKTPFGTFFTPNITPDKETGIGNWSIQDFIRAMHNGVSPKGKNYFPVFPYTSFTKINNDDLIAIKAYLDAIPAVHAVNKAPTAPWPFSWRFAQTFWKWLYFDKGYYQYNPDNSVQWNRGAYLVQGLGHCGECHTPRNIFGAMQNRYYLTGAFIDGYWAPDITGIEFKDTPNTVVVDVFDKAQLLNKAGPVRGPMAEVDHNSLADLTPYDLDAIAIYLKSVNSEQPRFPQGVPGKPDLETGQKVYEKVCAMCHDKGVAGAPMIYDAPNWTNRLQQGINTLYLHAINGFNTMPAKGGCVTCSDADVKAAVDYILANSQDTIDKNAIKGVLAPKPDTSIELGKQIYDKFCASCHNDGHQGAPKLGNKEEWTPLLKKNMDVLILNTITGIGNMPARGGCKQCKNSEIIAAVKYMAQQANPQGDYSLW